MENSNPIIENSIIQNNLNSPPYGIRSGGGGISMENSNPVLNLMFL